jgi:endonuclease YncB( thermonuclease family)
VIDGDTFVLYNVAVPAEDRVRVLGVDAAEIRDTLGPAARAFTTEWLTRGNFRIHTCKRDSFGRLLGTVTRGTDTLATALVNARLGTVP